MGIFKGHIERIRCLFGFHKFRDSIIGKHEDGYIAFKECEFCDTIEDKNVN